MAEWSIAAVLKTVEGNTSGGSNPSLSAIKPDSQAFFVSIPNFTSINRAKVGVIYFSEIFLLERRQTLDWPH